MKVGDTFPVSLAGSEVTRARVTNMEDGIATLRFEGQEVKMTYVTQLAPEAPAPVETPSKQVIIDEVVRTPAGESAPVGESDKTGETPAPVEGTDISTAVQTVEGAQEAPAAPVEAVENVPSPEGQS